MDFKIVVLDKYKLAALAEIAGKDSPEIHLQMRVDEILTSYAKQCDLDPDDAAAKMQVATDAQAKLATVK